MLQTQSPGFKALMVTQFLGALNDNLFKLLVSLLALKLFVTETSGSFFVSLAGALFVLPYILFSPHAGWLADRYPKWTLIRLTKMMEVAVMCFACLGFVLNNIVIVFVALFLMGLQSALFSPVKYGILPELLPSEELSRGNGYIQFWTFLAIILGTASGGFVMRWSGGNAYYLGGILIAIACIGLVASLKVTKTTYRKENLPFEWNAFRSVFVTLKQIHGNRRLRTAIYAATYFWFLGALFQMNALLYGKQVLALGDVGISSLLLVLAMGIGLGSLMAGRVSEGKVELGLVPLGAAGLTLFNTLLGVIPSELVGVLICLFLIGVSGGLYAVPLSAYIQKRSPHDQLGRYLAVVNLLSFTSMLFASVVLWLLRDVMALNAQMLFVVAGVLSGIATFVAFKMLPEMFVRCLNWLITHTFYRMRVTGAEHVPDKGGALLVCNHASYLDASFVASSLDRPVKFLMLQDVYDIPWIKPVADIAGVIPIRPKAREEVAQSLSAAQDAIRDGELVCIFAEGGLSRTGQMLPFRKGLERIMEGVDAPIIPVYLDKVWGSIFSFKQGRTFTKRPEELPYPIAVAFGEPMPGTSSAIDVRAAVQLLGTEAFKHRKEIHRLLHAGFLRQAKKHFWRICMVDTTGVKLRFGQALAAATTWAQSFRRLEAPRNMVGVLLPPSVVSALVNVALLIAGKVPVNLNYTTSQEAFESAKSQCQIQAVITSERMIKKLQWPQTKEMIMMEDVRRQAGLPKRMGIFLAALVLPRRWFARIFFARKVEATELATVIFSSGSTGKPKGVMLSHENIASNISAVYDVFQMTCKDAVVGVLPFFHSFGFTGTLWLPLLSGTRVMYHFSPLDAATLGDLVEKEKGSILMATPTFLSAYTRKCTIEQLKSLRHVIVGAEKLRTSVATAFEEKFGIQPLEGYGATELSPIATVNVPNFMGRRELQVGNKPGKIGHPLPGVCVRVRDSETGEEKPPGENGMLWVKGPNVMQGYLDEPALTQEVLQDDWYKTGDIANMDEDGFVMMTGRLSRFSKIAGEMVPHLRVEDAIHDVLGQADRICVVVGVSDVQKGERLVVLHTEKLDVPELLEQLRTISELPALWLPKQQNFYQVDALPLLGTGKLDLQAAQALAEAQV